MVQAATGSPLVRGAFIATRSPVSLRALRPFCIRGARVEPGTVFQINADDAAVLLGNRQAEPASDPKPAPVEAKPKKATP